MFLSTFFHDKQAKIIHTNTGKERCQCHLFLWLASHFPLVKRSSTSPASDTQGTIWRTAELAPMIQYFSRNLARMWPLPAWSSCWCICRITSEVTWPYRGRISGRFNWTSLGCQYYLGSHQLIIDHICQESRVGDIGSCSVWFRLYSFVGLCDHVPTSHHVLVRGPAG